MLVVISNNLKHIEVCIMEKKIKKSQLINLAINNYLKNEIKNKSTHTTNTRWIVFFIFIALFVFYITKYVMTLLSKIGFK